MSTSHHEGLLPEQRAALNTVRQLVDFWRIELHELEGRAPRKPRPALPTQPPRYRHPISGDTWDGQGAHPDWLRTALLKEGYTVDELRRAVLQAPGATLTASETTASDPSSAE